MMPMHHERVYVVWDICDGVRTGVADMNGTAHYFAAQFDESADDYVDSFKLYPVDAEFMQRALRNWAIYRAWECKFHSGEAKLNTHPGHGGIDSEYDELKSWLNDEVKRLHALPRLYNAKFRELPGQEARPGAMLREIEVAWSQASGMGALAHVRDLVARLPDAAEAVRSQSRDAGLTHPSLDVLTKYIATIARNWRSLSGLRV